VEPTGAESKGGSIELYVTEKDGGELKVLFASGGGGATPNAPPGATKREKNEAGGEYGIKFGGPLVTEDVSPFWQKKESLRGGGEYKKKKTG